MSGRLYQSALQMLGIRQKAYKSAFAVEGSPANLVLLDLAAFSRAFDPDPDNISHDNLMMMHGRRQMFFRIFKNVKLSPQELEIVSRTALVNAAQRLANRGSEE